MIKFQKKEGAWISTGTFDTWEDLPKYSKMYKERYPNALVHSTYSFSESMPGWPSVPYHFLLLTFDDESDEAEFILRESI